MCKYLSAQKVTVCTIFGMALYSVLVCFLEYIHQNDVCYSCCSTVFRSCELVNAVVCTICIGCNNKTAVKMCSIPVIYCAHDGMRVCMLLLTRSTMRCQVCFEIISQLLTTVMLNKTERK
jgi:hypothetical protein